MTGRTYFYFKKNQHYDIKSYQPYLLDINDCFRSTHDILRLGGLQPSAQAIQLMHDSLGYPVYFIQFISIAKLLGAIVILIPGLNRIKEWAYAGLFFDLAGAIYSGIASTGKFDPMMLTMIIWILPGI